MKVEFEDKSYLEITQDKDPKKALIAMVARDQNDKDNVVMISMDVDINTLKEMIASLDN